MTGDIAAEIVLADGGRLILRAYAATERPGAVLRLNPQGETCWATTAPHDDIFVSLALTDDALSATTWNGRLCLLDLESGALLSVDFVK